MPLSTSSSSSASSGDYAPRIAPVEVGIESSDKEYYDKFRRHTDLREPYGIPKEFLRGTAEVEAPTLPEVPTIVFINSRSGGRAGPALSNGLQHALGHHQVFDLAITTPDKVLKKIWENFEEEKKRGDNSSIIQARLRILAAGGDGTVAWVLQVVKRLELQPVPAVGVLPLGTGNDLSRSFGWGPTFNKGWVKNHSSIYKTLKRVSDAHTSMLDCWEMKITSPQPSVYFKRPLPYAFIKADARASQESFKALSWNYVSVGLDAQSAHGFHHLRETKPGLAFSRAANQFWYGFYGCKAGWFCCSQPVRNKVKLFVGDGDGQWKEVPVPVSVRAVVVCNLQSYAGGKNIWGKHTKKDAQKGWFDPTSSDGLVEVVGLSSGYHAGMVLAEVIHGHRIAQASAIRLELSAHKPGKSKSKVFMQMDGEPWVQDIPNGEDVTPLVVDITGAGQSKMLHNRNGLPNAILDMVAPILPGIHASPESKSVSKSEPGESDEKVHVNKGSNGHGISTDEPGASLPVRESVDSHSAATLLTA